MSKTIEKRRKYAFQIAHNGIVYNIGDTTMHEARKKAHQMVRRWIIKEWMLNGKNSETTATLLTGGEDVGTVYAYHRNRSVHVIIT